MKKALGFVATVTLMYLMAGCSAPNDSKSSAMPINYKTTIEFPKSLTVSSGSNSSIVSNGLAPDISAATSLAYLEVQSSMDILKTEAAIDAQYGILMNEVIRQNNLGTSGAAKSGLKIKITQAMIDNMKSALPSSIQDGADLFLASQLNQEILVPDFIYDKSSNANFDFTVKMTMPDGSGSNTFFWKSGYSRTAMAFDMTQEGVVFIMAYDEATNSALVDISGALQYRMKVVVDPAAAATRGVFLNRTSTSGSGHSMNAYADDTGGEVAEDLGNVQYIEDFSATGSLTYQKVGTNPADGMINTTYAAKLSPAPTDFGAASTFF